MKKLLVGLLITIFISLNFNIPTGSALSVVVHVPEKYTDVQAGDRFYFEIEIKFPENPSRQDLRLEYEIAKDGEVIAKSKVLKAIETQASFIDFIVIPESAKSGLHEIIVKIQDYEDLDEEVSASFNVLSGGEGALIQTLLYIIIGAVVITGSVIMLEVYFVHRKKGYSKGLIIGMVSLFLIVVSVHASTFMTNLQSDFDGGTYVNFLLDNPTFKNRYNTEDGILVTAASHLDETGAFVSNVYEGIKKRDGIFMEPPDIPKQLLDVKLELEYGIISSSKELIAIISFENFGTDPAEVDLEYVILNELGESVYSETGNITVYTVKTIIKQFDNLKLDSGKYNLVFKIEYGDNIRDEFGRDFEIKDEKTEYFLYGLVGIFLVIHIFFLIFIFKALRKKMYLKNKET